MTRTSPKRTVVYVDATGKTHGSLKTLPTEYGESLQPNEGSGLVCGWLRIMQTQSPRLMIDLRREWRFTRSERYKFDFAFPQFKVAVEVEGGIYSQGDAKKGHTGGKSYESNCRKYNIAASQNWLVIRLGPNMVERDWQESLDILHKTLKLRGWVLGDNQSGS